MSSKDVLGDRRVVGVLDRAVWGINPVLDLAYTDPLGLKGRTFVPNDAQRSAAEALLDGAARVLDAIRFPGTDAWSKATEEERARWWVTRLGAINTIAVAFPGMFGVLLNRLPIQDLLGFANQAVVLVAVAREHGVTDRAEQVDLLASVLCLREVEAHVLPNPQGQDTSDSEARSWQPFAVIGNLIGTARIFRAISGELEKRPQPGKVFSMLGNLPVVGAVAGYLGERGALVRAAEQGEGWIATRKARGLSGRGAQGHAESVSPRL
ncbi:hypothetical protein [Rhodococcus sp. NPDC058521]|uniref:hypothetical protein n=1 Tax=Rhodococcus sp. NPDC058521 TaxID=3346536 RepID=UPI003651552A